MFRLVFPIVTFALFLPLDQAFAEDDARVGEVGGNRTVVPTNQVISPAGKLVTFPGRPTDLAWLPDKKTVAVKNFRDLILLDVDTGTILQTLRLPGGGHSVAGLAVAGDGNTIYTSDAAARIHIAKRESSGTFRWDGAIVLPAPAVGGQPAPTGLAISPDGKTLLALSGRGNELRRFDIEKREPVGDPVKLGVAPFGIALVSADKAYVSNWGGEPAAEGQPRAKSSGTFVKVDPKTGVAASGSVSVVDLKSGKTSKSIKTGLHPSGMALSRDKSFLYLACANSDTVQVIDTATDEIIETIAVRPEARLPFGSGPNALAVSEDGSKLFVANGTNNAAAVIELGPRATKVKTERKASETVGFIPTGWYPGAILVRTRTGGGSRRASSPPREQLIVANIKGQGSRAMRADNGFNSHDHQGSVSIINAPDSTALATYTKQVAENNRQSLALSGLNPARPGIAPKTVPERHGEPSRIKHVVYIIKENRTYDQVFGDIPKGNGDPKLVLFGKDVTPNQHAMAEEFVLLDNFYCSGILSADGHAWATEAYATDYLERHFGGFVRSYPYDGEDPLAYSAGGFLWDNALARGKTFRNYGEFVQAKITPSSATWTDLYNEYKTGARTIKVEASPGVESLRPYICPTFIGFPGEVPDVYRAEEFLKEFREFEANGKFPNLVMMLLPNNHTEGTRPGLPTPRAMVADNDLALGRIVEAISKSRFWPETAIFVVEDDPQAGLDHVDGHRTIAQAISPYTRRGSVDHSFYSQIGMIKTMELMLGLPPMNQLDLAAPAMRNCFQETPDLRPFTARPNIVPLDELNPAVAKLSGKPLYWARKSMELELDEVDEADEDTLNRIIWHAVKGYDTPYPKLARATVDDEDDDDDDDDQ